MATTLSHGFIKPSNPDTGDVFFPALEQNIQLMNDHVHDGVHGARLTVATQTISAGSGGSNWIPADQAPYNLAGQPGTYAQTVTMPSGLNTAEVNISFLIPSLKVQAFPTIIINSGTSYDIYINDQSVSLTAVYSV